MVSPFVGIKAKRRAVFAGAVAMWEAGEYQMITDDGFPTLLPSWLSKDERAEPPLAID